MPAVNRVDPKTIFSPDEWRHLTSRSSWRGTWLVIHAWGTIAAAIALVTIWPNPLTWLIAVMIVGTRQLGLAILMHEAAHGGLHGNIKLNELIGQWLCAVPVGADLPGYRAYHLRHHKFTQQPEDPDLTLSAPFPISKDSFHAQGDPRPHRPDVLQAAHAAAPCFIRAITAGHKRDVEHEFHIVRKNANVAISRLECRAVCYVLARRRGRLVRRRVAVRNGDVAAVRHAHSQHCRTCLHLDRAGPVQPCPHDACEHHRARAGRALLGKLSTPSIICSCICRATDCRMRIAC